MVDLWAFEGTRTSAVSACNLDVVLTMGSRDEGDTKKKKKGNNDGGLHLQLPIKMRVLYHYKKGTL